MSQSQENTRSKASRRALDKELARIAEEAEKAARKAAQSHILMELRKLTGPHQLYLSYLTDRYIEVTGTTCDGSPVNHGVRSL